MIKDRVIQIIEQHGLTKEDFFQKIGMTSANFRGNAKNTPLNSNAIENILSEFPEVSAEWLLTGKGERLKENNNHITPIYKPTKYKEKILKSQEINLYDIRAVANLKTLFIEKDKNILGKIQLPNISRCDGAIYATGDSMDPIIKSGDIICYKEIYDFNNIIPGDMYLISMEIEEDEYLTIRFITRSEKEEGWVRIESYNQRHNPKDYEIKYINALALVKASIRMHTM